MVWSYIATILAPRYNISLTDLDDICVIESSMDDIYKCIYTDNSDGKYSDFPKEPLLIINTSMCHKISDKIFYLCKGYFQYMVDKFNIESVPVSSITDEESEKNAHIEFCLLLMHFGLKDSEILHSLAGPKPKRDVENIYLPMIEKANQEFSDYKSSINGEELNSEIKSYNLRAHKTAQKFKNTHTSPMMWWNDAVGFNGTFIGRGNPAMEGVRDDSQPLYNNYESAPVDENPMTVTSPGEGITYEEMLQTDHDDDQKFYLSLESLLSDNRKAK